MTHNISNNNGKCEVNGVFGGVGRQVRIPMKTFILKDVISDNCRRNWKKEKGGRVITKITHGSQHND